LATLCKQHHSIVTSRPHFCLFLTVPCHAFSHSSRSMDEEVCTYSKRRQAGAIMDPVILSVTIAIYEQNLWTRIQHFRIRSSQFIMVLPMCKNSSLPFILLLTRSINHKFALK